MHIAACVDPVIPGLGQWQAVAASMDGTDGGDASVPQATILLPYAPSADDEGNVTMIAEGLEPDPESGIIDEQSLRDFMRTLKPGDRIAGVRAQPSQANDLTDYKLDPLHYEGVVRRVRDANSLADSLYYTEGRRAHVADAPRNVTLVVYDSGKMNNDWEDVLSCEPHIMFVRYRAEIDAGDAKPTSLSLDGKPDDGEDGKQVTEAEVNPSDDSDSPVPANVVADKLADDAQFVAEAQARARGVETDKPQDNDDDGDDSDDDDDDDDRSLSLAWNRGTPMPASTLPVEQQSDDDLVASLEAAAEGGDTATQAAISAEIETRIISLSSDSGPDGKDDYAYTPTDKKEDWKLPIHDAAHTSAAAAALSAGGFRGQQADIPDAAKDEVKAKVRTAWQKHYPNRDANEMPDSIKASREDDSSNNAASECECGEKLVGGKCLKCGDVTASQTQVTEPTDGVPAQIAADGSITLSQASAPAAPAAPVLGDRRPQAAAPAAAPAQAAPARKGMNVAIILSRLGYEDMTGVTADNAEEMILAGIDALESKITGEAEAALTLSRQEMEATIQAARSEVKPAGGRQVSDIEVSLKTDNLELRLGNLIDAGRLTPAAASQLKKLYTPDRLTLSLSRGDDTLDKVLEIIAHNEPPVLTELTGAQAKGAVRLSRKTGKAEPLPTDDGGEAGGANPDLMADADRRRAEWEAQKARAASAR